MSVARSNPPAAGAAPVPASARRRRRAWRGPVLIALALVTVSVLGALGLPRGQGDLDPDSAAPSGARAVVRVLTAHGVPVEVVRSVSDLSLDRPVLVSEPRLAPYDTLLELADSDLDVVLLEPNAVTLDAFSLPLAPAGGEPARSADPRCADPDATAAGSVRAGGRVYRLAPTAQTIGAAMICYPQSDGGSAAGSVAGSVAVVRQGERRVTVIGQTDILRNQYLAGDGNAALALRLLGHGSTVQWYVPNPTELTADDAPALSELVPGWVRWVPVQLGLTVLVVVLWRGRRLGRLVAEPLPVVVRAAETAEGRARLYRQAGARDRAAATLRTATVRRLARRFEAVGGSPHQLAGRIAEATGRNVAGVRATLLGPAPADDAALVRLARALDEIEHEVGGTRPTTTQPPSSSQDGR